MPRFRTWRPRDICTLAAGLPTRLLESEMVHSAPVRYLHSTNGARSDQPREWASINAGGSHLQIRPKALNASLLPLRIRLPSKGSAAQPISCMVESGFSPVVQGGTGKFEGAYLMSTTSTSTTLCSTSRYESISSHADLD